MGKILTVSIAAYNVENYLEEALNSFIDEDILNKVEVLIVDDGSTDKTSEISKKYSNKYPNTFKYLNKENGGWGSTLNIGMQNACGKYFKQLDGDDFFDKNTLHKFVNYLENIDSDLVITNFITFKDGDYKIIEESRLNENLEFNTEYNFQKISHYMINIAMHNLTVKTIILKDNFEEIKLTEKCFYTDVEYLLKVLNNIKTVTFLPISVYWYRVARAGQSVSLEGLRKHYNEHLIVLKNLLNYMDNNVYEKKTKEFFINRLTTMASAQYERYLCLKISKESKKELIEFDSWLRKRYPDLYIDKWKKINLLRISNFIFYPAISCYTKKQKLSS